MSYDILTPVLAAPLLRGLIAAWYNADYMTLDSGLVSGARDLTGNRNDGTQTTSSKRSMFFPSDAMFGGRASFGNTSSAGNDCIMLPSMTAFHILMSVYYKDGVDTTFDTYSFFAGGPGSNGAVRVMGYSGQATLFAGYPTATYKNGTTVASNTVLPLPASVIRFDGDTTQTWDICGSMVSGSRVFVGGFRDVVFASSVLSTYQIQLIEGVMAWDSGTQYRLVANHPYRTSPPRWPLSRRSLFNAYAAAGLALTPSAGRKVYGSTTTKLYGSGFAKIYGS